MADAKPRSRCTLGVTMPLGGTYGNVRAEASFEDYLRDEDGGSSEALRRRVRKVAIRDLEIAVKRFFKKYRLDRYGKPKQEEIPWL